MGVLIILFLLVLLSSPIVARIVWTSGFLAGRKHEVLLWIASIDKLFPLNWQHFPISDDEMTPEQLKFANQVYAAAYRAALEHIKLDIAVARREVVEALRNPA